MKGTGGDVKETLSRTLLRFHTEIAFYGKRAQRMGHGAWGKAFGLK